MESSTRYGTRTGSNDEFACTRGEWRLRGLTGVDRNSARSHNVITNVGDTAANARIIGQGSYSAFVNIAMGTDTVAAADTSLGTEITTGGDRVPSDHDDERHGAAQLNRSTFG